VQEKAYTIGEAAPAKFPAEREHVIILHPDHVVGLDQRQHGVGKALVRPLIPFGEAALVLGQIDPVMEQRPQRPVRVAVVVLFDVLFLEVDGRGGDAFLALEVDVSGEFVGFAPRPAEPNAAMLAQGRRERHRQPSLRSPAGADPVRNDH
jgi:hypothetical protein